MIEGDPEHDSLDFETLEDLSGHLMSDSVDGVYMSSNGVGISLQKIDELWHYLMTDSKEQGGEGLRISFATNDAVYDAECLVTLGQREGTPRLPLQIRGPFQRLASIEASKPLAERKVHLISRNDVTTN